MRQGRPKSRLFRKALPCNDVAFNNIILKMKWYKIFGQGDMEKNVTLNLRGFDIVFMHS